MRIKKRVFVLFVFTAATRTDCGCYHIYTAATCTDCDCSHSMYGLIFRILYVFINDPCLICTVPFCLLTFVIRFLYARKIYAKKKKRKQNIKSKHAIILLIKINLFYLLVQSVLKLVLS